MHNAECRMHNEETENGKRGEGYVFTCIMILVFCIFLSVFLSFVSLVNIARISKRNTKNVLDSFVMKNSVAIFDSVKQGNDHIEAVDIQEFTDKLCNYSDLQGSSSYLYHYEENGSLQYRMSKPTVSMKTEKQLKIEVSYNLYIVVFWLGKPCSNITIPVTIRSLYTEKF